MWRRRTTFMRQVLVALDTVVSVAAYLAALFLRGQLAALDPQGGPVARFLASGVEAMGGLPPIVNRADYYWMLLGLIPVWVVTLHMSRSGDLRLGLGRVFGRYVRAVALATGLFILLAFLFKLDFLARTFVILLAAVQLTALALTRIAVKEASKIWRRRDDDGHSVLIVGSGPRAVEFAQMLVERAPIRLKILGYVSVPGEPGIAEASPHLGYVGSLDAILDRLAVDEVAFAVPGKQPEAFKEAIQACDERGVDVLVTLPPQVPSAAKMEIANVTGFNMPMLGLRRTPTDQFPLALKRILDLSGGLFGVIVAAPLLLLAAVLIRLDSPGPVLFRQVRAGRNGRRFTMYKFRSMVVDAEARKTELLKHNEMGGPVFKMKQDPRITRIGRFIRKTSIDELPQLFNVIKGDMSLVGPRPPLPSEVEGYESWQRRRLSVKPGLTGLWQVSGRNQVDFDEWMQMDLHYIDHWSLLLDLKIILKTVPAVLFQKGSS